MTHFKIGDKVTWTTCPGTKTCRWCGEAHRSWDPSKPEYFRVMATSHFTTSELVWIIKWEDEKSTGFHTDDDFGDDEPQATHKDHVKLVED